MQIRRSEDRGHAEHGWLRSYHTFSFADYYDPSHMGFRALRVINEDYIAADQGFGTHPHRDMEIVTYVLEGELSHKDSMGNGSRIVAGDVQYMSAGSGVLHSEFNASKEKTCHLLQIWILPNQKGAKPQYDQRSIPLAEKKNQWRLIVSGENQPGAISIRQDARLSATVLDASHELTYTLSARRHAWLHVARGEVTLQGSTLRAGDAAAVDATTQDVPLTIRANHESEVLLFDLN